MAVEQVNSARLAINIIMQSDLPCSCIIHSSSQQSSAQRRRHSIMHYRQLIFPVLCYACCGASPTRDGLCNFEVNATTCTTTDEGDAGTFVLPPIRTSPSSSDAARVRQKRIPKMRIRNAYVHGSATTPSSTKQMPVVGFGGGIFSRDESSPS